MYLCYRRISYENRSFALYLPQSKKNAKYRGINYQIPPPVKIPELPVTTLKYRGVTYIKKVFDPLANSALYN